MKIFTAIFVFFVSLLAAMESKYPLPVVPINDPVLNQIADEVQVSEIRSDEVQSNIEEMLEVSRTYRDPENGMFMVGLAAPQIGISKRIILVDMNSTRQNRDPSEELEVFINPEILDISDEYEETFEGCFSAGNLCGLVSRPNWVLIGAYDRDGNYFEEEYSGFTARIFQHEIDHLNGLRFPDRVEDESKLHIVLDDEKNEYRENYENWNKTMSKEEWIKLIERN